MSSYADSSIRISGPVGSVSIVLFYLSWPKASSLPNIERRSWKDLDFFGSLLLLAAAVLVIFAFQNAGGNADQWGHAVFLAPLLVGIACLIGLFVWEIIVERFLGDRLAVPFPLQLLRNHVYLAGMIHTMFLGFPYLMIIYAFPLRSQVVNGQSSLLAGVMLLPMLGGTAVGSVVGGMVNGKRDRMAESFLVSTCLMVLGCGLLSTLRVSSEVEGKALGFLVFVGFGFGMTASASTILANRESSIRDHGK